MSLNLPTDCDGFGKKFLVPHDLLCPKWGLVLARHNDAAKEWGDLSAWASNLVLYPTNLKSTLGQYRGKVTGMEFGSRQENRRGGKGHQIG